MLCWIALAANIAAVLVNLGLDRAVLAHGATQTPAAVRLMVIAALSALFLTGPAFAARALLIDGPIAKR